MFAWTSFFFVDKWLKSLLQVSLLLGNDPPWAYPCQLRPVSLFDGEIKQRVRYLCYAFTGFRANGQRNDTRYKQDM